MSDDARTQEHDWSEYYERTSARSPRKLLIDAIERLPEPGFAIDLGCGAGVETLELLRRGWRVLAIDGEAAAADHLMGLVPDGHRERIETETASFDEMRLPEADLIWSGLALPFCPPDRFDRVWASIIDALRPSGRIACDLWGPRHAWSARPGMTFLSKDRVQQLLASLTVEMLVEEDEERPTVFEGNQHWHAFSIIARREKR